MKILIQAVALTWGEGHAQPSITYIDTPEGTTSSEVARIHNTSPGIRIVSIDGQEYSRNTFARISDEAIFILPGRHSLSVEFCMCSADGSTYIEGTHTFKETFLADHDYGLIFNYAPPDRHELWLSHVFVNDKGRKKKELLATLGPFKLQKTNILYVPVY